MPHSPSNRASAWGAILPAFVLLLLIATLPGNPPPDAAEETAGVDWIAADAFGDIAARAGWRPVTDWVFDASPDSPRAIPGAGVFLDPTGDGSDLHTLESFGDLEVSGQFCLDRGSRAVLRFHGRTEIIFSAATKGGDATANSPGVIHPTDAEPVPARIGIACVPGVWHRFSVTVRAPRFGARGVRTEAARVHRVLLDGVILQAGVTVPDPESGPPSFEVENAPFALGSRDGAVAFRDLRGRPLELRGAVETPAPGTPQLTRVLVFSRTAGFRHSCIPDGVAAMKALGKCQGFAVAATEEPEEFLAWLEGTDVVVFMNTTGDILDETQQRVFEAYMRNGGGFLGVHAAADTEYDWPWYSALVGGLFAGHPAVQEADVQVVDRAHPATAMLPSVWTRTDEWYNYRERPPAGVRILATLDVNSYEGSTMGEGHPIAWCRDFAGGRSIYIGGGHTSESFSEPLFLAHLLGALRWAAGEDTLVREIPSNLITADRAAHSPDESTPPSDPKDE